MGPSSSQACALAPSKAATMDTSPQPESSSDTFSVVKASAVVNRRATPPGRVYTT